MLIDDLLRYSYQEQAEIERAIKCAFVGAARPAVNLFHPHAQLRAQINPVLLQRYRNVSERIQGLLRVRANLPVPLPTACH